MRQSILTSFLFLSIGFQWASGQDSVIGRDLLQKSDSLYAIHSDSFLYYRQLALPYLKKAETWENYLDAQAGIAEYYSQNGDYDRYKAMSLEAIHLTEEYLGKANVYYSATLNNYGYVLRKMGDYKKAQEYYQNSLEVDRILKADKRSMAISYSNLGSNFRRMGDYEQAINYYNQAHQLQTDTFGLQHFETARTTLFTGHCYRDLQQYKKAKANYYTFLKAAQNSDITQSSSGSNSIVYCYQSLAKIFLQEGQSDSSNYYIKQALGFKDYRKMQSYEVLGDLYSKKGQYSKALDAFTLAHEAGLKKYKKYDKHYSKAHNLKQIGETLFKLGQVDQALAQYQQALILLSVDFSETSIYQNSAPENMISKRKGMEIIRDKAQAFLHRFHLRKDQKDLQTAFEHFQDASQLIQQLRRSFLAQGSKELLAANALSVYEGGIEAALLMNQQTGDQQYLEEAYSFAERNKAVLLLESLQEADAKFSGALPESAIAKEEAFRIEITFYEKKIIEERQKKEKADQQKLKFWQNKHFDLQQRYQELIANFEKDYPQYYQLKYSTQPASIKSLREKVIDEQTALLEYFVGKEKSYAFCLTQNGLKVFPFSLEEGLTTAIGDLRSTISQAPNQESFLDDCKNFAALSQGISQALIEMPLRDVPASVKRLIVIPDDVLAYLPFELLFSEKMEQEVTDFFPEHLPYLLNRFAISYNYSATLLLNHFDVEDKKDLSPFIGFAPSFGKAIAGNSRACTGSELYALNCNQQEVEGINSVFGGHVLLAQAANRQSFLEEAKDYRIVHLATHACAGDEDLSQNKIHFTDDFISNIDLHQMQLNAELAVLSACNTGSGKLVKGEGVMSLSRGFILAGCPSTLMSLWSVDDCITSEIMLGFYQKLQSGLSKDEALRQAKLDHLKKADKASAHPYYWAAFVQSGNAEAMDFSRTTALWKWGLVLLIGIVGLFLFKK